MDATRVVLRPELFAAPPTVAEALLAAPSSAGVTAAELARQHAEGLVVDVDGNPVDLSATVLRAVPVYLYRDLPEEFDVPFEMEILHVDESLVVVDKPHFLATMPRGRHVTQTALVRLRRLLDSPDLAPAHRLDRLTAGVLLFTRRPAERAAYQRLFAERLARKEYRAIAPLPTATSGADTLTLPELVEGVRVENRIVKTAGDLRALVVDGPANAVSDVTLERVRPDGLGEYRLVPHTGRTHQLRLHMAGLGVPILDDPLYPEVDADLAAAPDRGDFSRPLRLIASSLAFADPITGAERRFESRRT
ncbi:MAG: pseudouridine synthase [Gordonia sp. (in: high G+C Gram-positive bacteria)]|uniref:pseudouridine synthase n=1 Tax=Gordonia sp. (in: high G+C Gram-positive bacteria) TaxID=84139 RepID=UPI0039E72922